MIAVPEEQASIRIDAPASQRARIKAAAVFREHLGLALDPESKELRDLHYTMVFLSPGVDKAFRSLNHTFDEVRAQQAQTTEVLRKAEARLTDHGIVNAACSSADAERAYRELKAARRALRSALTELDVAERETARKCKPGNPGTPMRNASLRTLRRLFEVHQDFHGHARVSGTVPNEEFPPENSSLVAFHSFVLDLSGAFGHRDMAGEASSLGKWVQREDTKPQRT